MTKDNNNNDNKYFWKIYLVVMEWKGCFTENQALKLFRFFLGITAALMHRYFLRYIFNCLVSIFNTSAISSNFKNLSTQVFLYYTNRNKWTIASVLNIPNYNIKPISVAAKSFGWKKASQIFSGIFYHPVDYFFFCYRKKKKTN